MSTNESTNIRTTAYVNDNGGVNAKVEKYIGSTWFTTQDAEVCATVETFLERYPDEPVLGLVRAEFESPTVENLDEAAVADFLNRMTPRQLAAFGARFNIGAPDEVGVDFDVKRQGPDQGGDNTPPPAPGAEERVLEDGFPGVTYLRKATPPITTYGQVAMLTKDQIVAVRGIGTVTADEIFADPLVSALRAERV